MASSSESMEDSFKSRVAKAFGSLSSSQSSSSSSSLLRPLWSLTDEEVEKREWNRQREKLNRDDETPCSSSFDGLFSKDRKRIAKNKSRNVRSELDDDVGDLNDDDDDDDDGGRIGTGSSKQAFDGGDGDGDGDGNDEWEIRSSIGLDCTLDNEEEEDEFDKVAEGRENAGDRLFMRDATDHGPYLNSHNVLSYPVNDPTGNPCANHLAARARPREDDAEAHKVNSFHTSDKSMRNVEEPCVKVSEDASKPKSILKRKVDSTIFKSQKRVRFDPAFKDDSDKALERPEEFLTGAPSVEAKISDDNSSLAKRTRKVPDYVLNPSKYTRYSLDSSSEVDEESNRRACMDFLNLVKGSKPISGLENVSAEIPRSVTFIPRKKASDAKAVNNSSAAKQNHEDESKDSSTQTGFPVGIAAEVAEESEVCIMEEDEPEKDAADTSAGSQKPGRCYRIRTNLEDSVS